MKKILIPLLAFALLTACSKEQSNNPSSQTTTGIDLSGTWRGNLSSPNCISTTGCNTNGHLAHYPNTTFAVNGNAVTITGIYYFDQSTQIPAHINGNTISIPYYDHPIQALNIRTGTITINNNSALVNIEYFNYGTLNGNPTNIICCTYYLSGTLTKQ